MKKIKIYSNRRDVKQLERILGLGKTELKKIKKGGAEREKKESWSRTAAWETRNRKEKEVYGAEKKKRKKKG